GQMTALRGESAEDTPILAKVVGSAVTITLRGMEREHLEGVEIDTRTWRDLRHIHGVVRTCTDHVNADTGDLVLTMQIVPRLHLLAMVQTFEVYLDRSLPDIFKAKLEAAGLAEGVDFEFILKGDVVVCEFLLRCFSCHFVLRLWPLVGVPVISACMYMGMFLACQKAGPSGLGLFRKLLCCSHL
ncbi:MAG TPA: contractile injection system protein, VgrG/Pvc8 family, partial [Candidatus Obscuribacter sp.]|nr:contractile injection system protein, VgrG/Pvc8 family [Candidatus Obscuribacter sp.]